MSQYLTVGFSFHAIPFPSSDVDMIGLCEGYTARHHMLALQFNRIRRFARCEVYLKQLHEKILLVQF